MSDLIEDIQDNGPTIEEAKILLEENPHEVLPEAADLPTDVRDGEITKILGGDDN